MEEKVNLDHSKLKGRIVERYGTQHRFAEAFGISIVQMSAKMRNRSSFSVRDILKICKMLEIPTSQIGDFFFTEN